MSNNTLLINCSIKFKNFFLLDRQASTTWDEVLNYLDGDKVLDILEVKGLIHILDLKELPEPNKWKLTISPNKSSKPSSKQVDFPLKENFYISLTYTSKEIPPSRQEFLQYCFSSTNKTLKPGFGFYDVIARLKLPYKTVTLDDCLDPDEIID